MSLVKLPIVASPITLWKLGAAFITFCPERPYRECFARELGKYLGKRDIFLTCSGRSSLYNLLNVLKNISPRKEILLPAFTASSLGAAINKAGLKVHLVDISLETFNLDIEKLPEALSQDILAIIPVHMFGLACDIERIAQIIRGQDIFLVEDFAQSMGTVVKGEETGTLSNIAFTSFARGKNLPTYSGGMLTIDDIRISRLVGEESSKIKENSLSEKFSVFFKLMAFTLVSNSYLYGYFSRWVRAFGKEIGGDFENKNYTDLPARVGFSLLKKFDSIKEKRYENGRLLYQGLKGLKGIRLPKILEGSKPVFNRFPVLFDEVKKKSLVSRRLNSQGIEALPLYEKPLHKVYPELNGPQRSDNFPVATYFAEHHLCLPTHPRVRPEDIARILQIFKDSL